MTTTSTAKSPSDPWKALDWYVDSVLSGSRVVSRLEQLVVERHVRDLEQGGKRGLVFDRAVVDRVFRFFSLLRHPRGIAGGKPFILAPFQAFQIANVYGWMREDGTRRFRDVFEEVPRKNGKTTKLAGIGLFGLVGELEKGPMVYAAATKRDQAKILFNEASLMRRMSPRIRRRTRQTRDSLTIVESGAKFEPLGADADTLEGLNPSLAMLDEFQSHKSRDLHDVLDTATGARPQPLIWRIGTAGVNRASICWEQREHSIQVLEQRLEDDGWFCFIATIDPGDDPMARESWLKANPNLGVTPTWESMERQAKAAARSPGALSSFLRYRLDVWTQAEDGWIHPDTWDQCGSEWDLDEMRGVPCYAGLDLSSTTDLTAFALCWPTGGDPAFRFAVWHWIPEETAAEAQKRDRVPYLGWQREGWMQTTEGNIVDYVEVRRKIVELSRRFDIQEIAFDRYNATETAMELQNAGLRMVEQPQGIRQMSEPAKKFYRLLESRQIDHRNDPCLRWQAGNITVITDDNENIKPTKRRSKGRIDGLVAMLMALARTIHGEGPSVYTSRGVMVL